MAASSIPGEPPPQPPRVCFGRDGLVEGLVRLAENHEPFALIGAAGIGKTSIALTVLHHNRIKERFGYNRRFIRCDQFPASRTHLLARLSKVIGAGVENPEDLTPLRPFLASIEMILFLDNAESILDPQGTDALEMYTVVEELSRFDNICLGITSRISTVPPHCKRPVIPTLSKEAACNIFYSIYDDDGRSDTINDLIQRLDFHALSITLLATTASHNMWDYKELAEEWDAHRAQALRTDYNESLAATIELSLTSPTFRKLGPHARELLEVIAFFPQGIDRNNLDWLFPTIPDRKSIFDKFCVLSLTHRNNGFITMLAPIRDYLGPRDPRSSPLLCTTKGFYFSRLSTEVNPQKPSYEATRWIISEDGNVEHLLDVFTSIDSDSDDVWNACAKFMEHLYWHKKPPTILRSKIEGVRDDHRSKPQCLYQLSRLLGSVGNFVGQKRFLTHILILERVGGDDLWVAKVLVSLSDANRLLGLYEEGIRQAKEALGIFERLGDITGQGSGLSSLALLLYDNGRFDAAEEAATCGVELLQGKGQEFLLCQSHQVLGNVYRSKGEIEKALRQYEVALEIASPFGWHNHLFWIHHSMILPFLDQGRFEDAQFHLDKAKPYTINNAYSLGILASSQAEIWWSQHRLEGAKCEVSRALEIFQKFGAAKLVDRCRRLLWGIEESMKDRDTSSGGYFGFGNDVTSDAR